MGGNKVAPPKKAGAATGMQPKAAGGAKVYSGKPSGANGAGSVGSAGPKKFGSSMGVSAANAEELK